MRASASDWGERTVRSLSWLHRWSGVFLSLLFVMWFASGAVLSFVPFPALGAADRLAMSRTLAAHDVTVAPAAALAAAGGGDTLDLVAWPDRAVYVAGKDGAPLVAVDARSGAVLPPVDPAEASRIASTAAHLAVKAVSRPIMYDQWVVHPGFDAERPLYRVRMADPASTDLYVSARSGHIVQRTRFSERAWNWTGAVIHWIYFTPLRKSQTAWDQTVWWISLAGVITALLGLGLGGYRTIVGMARRRPDWSPFRGWLRWHHGVGLGVGVFVVTWIVSGWLSMDHGRLFPRSAPVAAAAARYEGRPLAQALAGVQPARLGALFPSRDIAFTVVGGHAIASADAPGGESKVIDLAADGPPRAALNPDLLSQSLARGWPLARPGPASPAHDDDLFRAAEDLPGRAVSYALARPQGAYLYVDPVNGQLLAVMDRSRQAYAWAYFALHTFKFPGLVDRPVLRRAIEFTPLAFGLAFSITGLVISLQRLRLLPR